MLTPYLIDPSKAQSIEEQIEGFNAANGKAHAPRNLSSYMEPQELLQFQHNQSILPESQKVIDMCSAGVELITRALILDEGMSRGQAEQCILITLGTEKELLPRFQSAVQIMVEPVAALLEAAGALHCEVTRQLFIAAMKLNLADFRALFPERLCVHDPDAVIQKLKNPDFTLNNEQRKLHFAKNKELSFSIMNSLSTWEIAGIMPMQAMQVLQNSARYNVLKAVFSEQPQQNRGPQPVQLQNELNGTDV